MPKKNDEKTNQQNSHKVLEYLRSNPFKACCVEEISEATMLSENCVHASIKWARRKVSEMKAPFIGCYVYGTNKGYRVVDKQTDTETLVASYNAEMGRSDSMYLSIYKPLRAELAKRGIDYHDLDKQRREANPDYTNETIRNLENYYDAYGLN